MNTRRSLISRRQRFRWGRKLRWGGVLEVAWHHTHYEVCVGKSEKESETTRYSQEFLQAGCAQRQERVLMRVPTRKHRVGIVIVMIAAAALTTIGMVPMNTHNRCCTRPKRNERTGRSLLAPER